MLAESQVSRYRFGIWGQMSTKHCSSEMLSFDIFSVVSHGSGLYEMNFIICLSQNLAGEAFDMYAPRSSSMWNLGPQATARSHVGLGDGRRWWSENLEGNWIKKQAWELKWEFGTVSWFFQIKSLSIANLACLTFPSSWILIHRVSTTPPFRTWCSDEMNQQLKQSFPNKFEHLFEMKSLVRCFRQSRYRWCLRISKNWYQVVWRMHHWFAGALRAKSLKARKSQS